MFCSTLSHTDRRFSISWTIWCCSGREQKGIIKFSKIVRFIFFCAVAGAQDEILCFAD